MNAKIASIAQWGTVVVSRGHNLGHSALAFQRHIEHTNYASRHWHPIVLCKATTKGRGLSQYGLLALAESSEKVFQFFRGQGSTSTWKAQRPAFENGYRLEESWLAAGDLGKQLVSTFG